MKAFNYWWVVMSMSALFIYLCNNVIVSVAFWSQSEDGERCRFIFLQIDIISSHYSLKVNCNRKWNPKEPNINYINVTM
ncbi:unnamed protein product [Pieris brassicae]|uniref:Uncharacterized protein n=1 Tax=Pieris brassicae TaxID=7116 RepID=A0A9P0TRU7_PIEBR|nr:unnamed protein product [Pieris brassicae]